ncbi:hypothetical protein, partial [Escherichia coli]|uniref:hypothetical protein n=2 Tax=Escherichia coli TaxID=562 RepID=UPI001BDBCBD2
FSDPGPVFHTIVSIKNDGHYFCRAGGNRPDGLNEPVTNSLFLQPIILSKILTRISQKVDFMQTDKLDYHIKFL